MFAHRWKQCVKLLITHTTVKIIFWCIEIPFENFNISITIYVYYWILIWQNTLKICKIKRAKRGIRESNYDVKWRTILYTHTFDKTSHVYIHTRSSSTQSVGYVDHNTKTRLCIYDFYRSRDDFQWKFKSLDLYNSTGE